MERGWFWETGKGAWDLAAGGDVWVWLGHGEGGLICGRLGALGDVDRNVARSFWTLDLDIWHCVEEC